MKPTVAAVFLVMALAPSAGVSQEEPELRGWSAPPYWSPPAGAHAADREVAGTEGARGGREALALPSPPLPFVAIMPCRQYDSRSSTPLQDNTPRTVTLTGAPCGIPASAQAAAVNITVFNITGAGSNGVFKVGVASPPSTAWINYPSTETQRANAGVVALTGAGAIVVQVNQGAGFVDFVVDVAGYYAPVGIVNSVNTLSGDVTLSPGSNVTITPGGQTLTISASGAAGPAGPTGPTGPTGPQGPTGPAGSVPSGSMILGAPGDTTLVGAGFTEIGTTSISYWTATASAGAPGPRFWHTAVWTGTRMIVWGGLFGTGVNTGGRYDPVANSWTSTNLTGAPAGRYFHTAVWTGSKMVIWGGTDGSVALGSGGQYDPVGDSWTATTTTGAPTPRYLQTAVWTGTQMIVWGGAGSFLVNTGGRYDPLGNSWTPTTTTGAPTARWYHAAVWTGTKMVVWGGSSGIAENTGGQYDPVGDSWTATTTTGAPSARMNHTAIWTGTRMVVWGGGSGAAQNTGGQYDPSGDAWSPTTTVGAPEGRVNHSAVWTGSKMIVWGGIDGAVYLNTGAQYDPLADSWTATGTTGAPPGRVGHRSVWTGSRMVVWGGFDGGSYLDDGGQLISASLYLKN